MKITTSVVSQGIIDTSNQNNIENKELFFGEYFNILFKKIWQVGIMKT